MSNTTKKTIPISIAIILLISISIFFINQNNSIKIGFIGSMTGRVADLGIAGRDGFLLAIEDINNAGGINGKKITPVIMNDKNDKDTLEKIIKKLSKQRVKFVVGPMTSSMATASVELVNKLDILMISPTTSTNELTGIDDNFIRNYPASKSAAKKLSNHASKEMGLQSIAIFYDLSNAEHTESWRENFIKYFETNSRHIEQSISFISEPATSFKNLVNKLNYNSIDGVFILANAMDTAHICQQISIANLHLPIITSEWSATEDLLFFGGRTIEGLMCTNTFDRNSKNQKYLDFYKKFLKRFGRKPGFAATHSYNSTQIISSSIEDNSTSKTKLNILNTKQFNGLQGEITIDKFGDCESEYYLIKIVDGKFQTVE